MKKNYISRIKSVLSVVISLAGACYAQIPTANFSIFPNPVCQGQAVQITNQSTGNPTTWSYTVGVPNSFYSAQSPSFTAGAAGTMTVKLMVSNSTGSSTTVMKTLTVIPIPNAVINPTTPGVCAPGASITFTASNLNTGNTFSWSSGATGSITTVSPMVTTTYSLVVTNTAGCSVTKTTTVTVGATTSISANPLTICQGGSVTLSANGSGAFFPFTYTWSTGTNGQTINTNLPGIYTATVTNGIGCTSFQSYTLGTSSTLSLSAQASTAAVCAGINTQLSVKGANSYTWSTNSTSPFVSVSPNTTTTYSVLGATSTCTGSAFITVTVIPTPTLAVLNNTTSICAGQTATLNLSGASNFSLNNVSSGSAIVVSPLSNTTYTLKGTTPGCPNGSMVVTVTVTPIPTLQIASSKSIACEGDKLTYTVSGASTYSWSTGSTVTTTSLIATANTTLVSVGGNSSNCSANSSYTQQVKLCTGIDKNNSTANLVRIFPNPGKEIYISSESDHDVVIMDQCGRLIRQIKLYKQQTILISELPPGFYYLVATNEGILSTQRLMISD